MLTFAEANWWDWLAGRLRDKAIQESGPGLEISLLTCGWFCYRLITTGIINPQISRKPTVQYLMP